MERHPITTLPELHAAADHILSVIRTRGNDPAVLALSGELGAGKTTFMQTLARALGVTETVTSPTFVIMRRYETTDPVFRALVHIDAYRIESVDELRVLGFAELLAKKGTIIGIEWPERVGGLPPDAVHLSFDLRSDGTRTLTVS